MDDARPRYRTATKIPATYNGERGTVVSTQGPVLWFQPTGNTEKLYFSLRRDDVWRKFPGPADGPGLHIGKV